MKFTKMHGIGNDYVYVNCFEETVSNPSVKWICITWTALRVPCAETEFAVWQNMPTITAL